MDIRIIIRLDSLIVKEMTGSPKQLASKLGITERSVYNYISFMKKEMKAPIVYNYQRFFMYIKKIGTLNLISNRTNSTIKWSSEPTIKNEAEPKSHMSRKKI